MALPVAIAARAIAGSAVKQTGKKTVATNTRRKTQSRATAASGERRKLPRNEEIRRGLIRDTRKSRDLDESEAPQTVLESLVDPIPIAQQVDEANMTAGAAKKLRTVRNRVAAMSVLFPLWATVFAQWLAVASIIIGISLEYLKTEYLFGYSFGIFSGQEWILGGFSSLLYLGLGTLITAVILLTFRGINCFTLRSLTFFVICLFAYVIPVLFLIPWVFFYGWKVAEKK